MGYGLADRYHEVHKYTQAYKTSTFLLMGMTKQAWIRHILLGRFIMQVISKKVSSYKLLFYVIFFVLFFFH